MTGIDRGSRQRRVTSRNPGTLRSRTKHRSQEHYGGGGVGAELGEYGKCHTVTPALSMHLSYARLDTEKSVSSKYCGDRSVGALGNSPLDLVGRRRESECVRSVVLKLEHALVPPGGPGKSHITGPASFPHLQDFLTQ